MTCWLGSSSLTVLLEYSTYNYDDKILLWDRNNNQIASVSNNGDAIQTRTITVPGNYVKITFVTDERFNYSYGFKATITANP